MQWSESGLLLSTRPHGETSAIANIYTRGNGRYSGIVHGATSLRRAAELQPGNQFHTTWRAKIPDNLGWFHLELEKSRSVAIWSDRTALSGMTSVCSLVNLLLPEREAYAVLHDITINLVDSINSGEEWLLDYALWEKRLIADIGFGLELDRCAVTGTTGGLVYVSPRSGRAVSSAGAGDWAERLLPLPQCYLTGRLASNAEILDCLQTSGHFIGRALESVSTKLQPPAARDRFVEILKEKYSFGGLSDGG